jgi:hypothetical protein
LDHYIGLFKKKNVNFYRPNWQISQKIVIVTSTPSLALQIYYKKLSKGAQVPNCRQCGFKDAFQPQKNRGAMAKCPKNKMSEKQNVRKTKCPKNKMPEIEIS